MTPPPSQFGSLADDGDGAVSTHAPTIDWTQVVSQEPDNVAHWLHYLHCRKHLAIKDLFPALSQQLNQCSSYPPQWDIFAQTSLPLTLIDILSEPEMFSTEPGVFTSVCYGMNILALLSCCAMLTAHHPGGGPTDQCASTFFEGGTRFFNVLWDKRDLLVRHRFTEDELYLDRDSRDLEMNYPEVAMTCAVGILYVIRLKLGKTFPLQIPAAHFMLFCWTHCMDVTYSSSAILWLNRLLRNDMANVHQFTRDFVQTSHPDFPTHFIYKTSLALREKNLIGDDADRLNFVCSAMLVNNPDPFSLVTLDEATDLIPSLILCYHRQLCSSSLDVIHNFRSTLPRIINSLMSSFGRHHVEAQLARHAGELNLIAIVSDVMIGALERNKLQDLEPAITLLNHIQSPLSDRVHLQLEHGAAPEYANLERTTGRIWHSTLQSLLAIRPCNPQHESLKLFCLQAWRTYGSLFHLREGVNFAIVNPPSVARSESGQEEIPKRCCWVGCGCSALPKAPHTLQACKGCWKVVYCGPKCQQSDWEAGHRLLCHSDTRHD